MRSNKIGVSLAAVTLSVAVLTGCGAATGTAGNTTAGGGTSNSSTHGAATGNNLGGVVAKYDKGAHLTKSELDKQYNLQVVLPGVDQTQEPKQAFLTYYIVFYKHVYSAALKTFKPNHSQAVNSANQAIAQLASPSGGGYKDKEAVLAKMKALGISQADMVKYFEQQQVIQGYLDEQMKVSDAEAQAYFKAHPLDFAQVSVHHILLNTKTEAENVEKQLKAGANFEKLADKFSKDPSVSQNHGAFTNVEPITFVPEFAHACETQPVGAIGNPVQTTFGFHVIRVDKRQPQTYAKVKADVVKHLQTVKQKAIYDAALKSANIQVLSKSL